MAAIVTIRQSKSRPLDAKLAKLPDAVSMAVRKAACKKVLDAMWSPMHAEQLVDRLLPSVLHAMGEEAKAGVPLGEMVRTQRFAERVHAQVLTL